MSDKIKKLLGTTNVVTLDTKTVIRYNGKTVSLVTTFINSEGREQRICWLRDQPDECLNRTQISTQ